MRTHSFDTCFAAFGDSRLHCAAATPNAMVKSTEKAACMAPVKGTMSSDTATPMVDRVAEDCWTELRSGCMVLLGNRHTKEPDQNDAINGS